MEFFLKWLPVCGWVLGGTCLFAGIVSGIYHAVRVLLGSSYHRLLRYSEDTFIERIIFPLLGAGIGGLIGGMYWEIMRGNTYDEVLLLYEMGIAGVLGGFVGSARALKSGIRRMSFTFTNHTLARLKRSHVPADVLVKLQDLKDNGTYADKEKFSYALTHMIGEEHADRYATLIWKSLQRDGIFPGSMRNWEGWKSLVVRTVVGMIIGLLVGIGMGITMFFALDKYSYNTILSNGITSIVVCGLAGGIVSLLHNEFVSSILTGGMMTGLFLGFPLAVGGVIISGLLDGYSARAETFLLLGVPVGVSLGFLAGFCTVLLLPIQKVVDEVVSFGIATILIPRKFKAILCQQCHRSTHPRESLYDNGIRYCEHCHQPVEHTK